MAEAPCQRPEAASARGPSAFYGWRIVGVAFFVDFIAVGFFFYSYGVFFKALAAELGGSRLGVGMGLLLTNVVGAAIAPFLGRALDALRVKRIMMLGAVSVSAGFLLLSQIRSAWQFYAVLATFTAVGMATMGGLSTAKLVANWFEVRRGTALGIATMGISLSGMMMPPVADWLIDHLTWRGAFAVYGVLTLALVLPVVARFVVNRPEEMGLRPDGDAAEADGGPPSTPDAPPWRTRALLRTPDFWALALSFALVLCSLSALLTHLVPHATDLGFSRQQAAFVLSVVAGCGVLGKVIFGWLVDRLDPRLAVWGSFGTQLAGLLLVMAAEAYPALLAAGAVFGLGMGGVVPLHGALSGRCFGRQSFGKVMGLMRPVMVPIHALGVPFAGWVFDRTGSYAAAFQTFAVCYLLACVAIATLRLRAAPRRGAQPSTAR